MRFLIWGDFGDGHKAKDIITKKLDEADVIGFVDRDRKKRKNEPYYVVDLQQMLVQYKKKKVEKIIIPSFYERNLFRDILFTLSGLDIEKEDVIVPPIDFFCTEKEYSLQEFLTPWYKAKQIDYIEFATTDHCNLNCKSCARFAPLAPNTFYDHDDVKESFKRLHEFFSHINMIRILGGEPFLDENVNDYFPFLRSLYPYSEIRVVTNGLLLDRIGEEMFKEMVDYNIGIDISFYPPMETKIDKVREILESQNIDYRIESGEVFYKSFNLKSDDNVRQKKNDCMQWCISLKNGHIYPCATSATVNYFKDEFNLDIPSEEGMDLYDSSISTETIKCYLSKPIMLCKYCEFKKMDLWDTCKGKCSVSDWDVSCEEI